MENWSKVQRGRMFVVFWLDQPPVLDPNQSMIAGCFVTLHTKENLMNSVDLLDGLIPEDEKVVPKPSCFSRKHTYQTTGSNDSGIKERKNLHLVDIEYYI